jgi:hypothetical protein
MNKLLIATAALGLLGLAGCADYLAVDHEGHTTAAPPKPSETPAQVKGDQCHAAQFAYLVGKPKSEVPVAADLSKRRVYCATCAVTMDYSPARLNILFDKDTDVIVAVKCG